MDGSRDIPRHQGWGRIAGWLVWDRTPPVEIPAREADDLAMRFRSAIQRANRTPSPVRPLSATPELLLQLRRAQTARLARMVALICGRRKLERGVVAKIVQFVLL